jgi:hypothetical protein
MMIILGLWILVRFWATSSKIQSVLRPVFAVFHLILSTSVSLVKFQSRFSGFKEEALLNVLDVRQGFNFDFHMKIKKKLLRINFLCLFESANDVCSTKLLLVKFVCLGRFRLLEY